MAVGIFYRLFYNPYFPILLDILYKKYILYLMSIVTEKIKWQKIMKKINKKLAIAFAIVCVISCVANYFQVLATPVTKISFGLSIVIAFLAMMQVYNYQNWAWDHNPGTFWFGYSAISGAILVVIFHATGLNLIDQQLSLSLFTGLTPMLIPVAGAFLGDCGRVFKAESSII